MRKSQLNIEYKEIIFITHRLFLCSLFMKWESHNIYYLFVSYIKRALVLFFVQLDKSSCYLRKKKL